MGDTAKDLHCARLESLVELAQLLGRQSEYEEVLRLVVEKASLLVRSDSALVMMINPRTRDTVKTVYAEKRTADKYQHFAHTSIAGWVVLHHSPLFSPDLRSDVRFRKNLFDTVETTSAICVPFSVDNVIIGTLMLLNGEKSGPFTEYDLSLIERLSAIVSPFLHRTQAVAEYFNTPLPKQALQGKYAALGLLGKSKEFVDLLLAVEAAARCDVRILLEGESGTGKELVARAVHTLSGRNQRPFVAIDCGAIQPNLVESELFGHVRGAFTGAANDRKGLMEEAAGGTLFIDEINNLPVDMQSKLLRVLEDGEIRPVGSNQRRKIDVRIISASSSSLRKLVVEKTFREDLYYRLNVYPIDVPSLSQRVEDIPMLADHFLKKFSGEQHKEIGGFKEEILDFLKQRHWAGNVRELRNVVERLVTLTTKKQKIVDRGILPPDLQKEMKKLERTRRDPPITRSLGESLADHEEQLIRKALESCDWNQSGAARILQISEHSMRYKMTKLGINRPA
jgi:transcriptional regulator with GAF, ATPase, and Fis domain